MKNKMQVSRRRFLRDLAVLGAGTFAFSREPIGNGLVKALNYMSRNEKIDGQKIYVGEQCIKLVPFRDYNPPNEGKTINDPILEIAEEIGDFLENGMGIYGAYFDVYDPVSPDLIEYVERKREQKKKEKILSKRISDDFLEKYGNDMLKQDSKKIVESLARFIVDKITYFIPGDDNLRNYERGIGVCRNYADYMKFGYRGLQEKNPILKNTGSFSISSEIQNLSLERMITYILESMGIGGMHEYSLFYSKIPDKTGNLQGTLIDTTWADVYSFIPSGVFSIESFEVDDSRFSPVTRVGIQRPMMNTEITLSLGNKYLKNENLPRNEKSEIAKTMANSIDDATTLLYYGDKYLNGPHGNTIYSFVKKHYLFSSKKEAENEMAMLMNESDALKT